MKKLLLETSFSKIYMIVMILITLLILGGYFSYAMFTVSKEKSNAISIVTGNLTYKLEVDGEEGNELVVPANTTKEFTITLSNPNNRIARFNFYYMGTLEEGVDTGYIEGTDYNTPPSETGINLEASGTSGSINTYLIRVTNTTGSNITINLGVSVGLDYNDLTLPSNGHFFNEYIDEPNAPELDNGMIAVTYSNGNWVKADRSNIDNSWYNYYELKWANAVTVSESSRENYLSADVGTIVNMDDIETMWVWIPRYSYTIGSEDGTNYYGKQGEYLSTTPTQELPGEIDIKFVSSDIKDKGSAKYIVSEGISNDDWYTPDAFTFGDKELNGIWVGKFETSSSNPSASYGGGNVTNLDPVIKPNVISWRNINVSNAFNVALKMNDSGNRYGFTSNVDTHMMKSSEWGVVSYLSQSKYGKLGNTNFSGSNKEVYQNKSNSIITGCSYGSPSNANTDYGCQYTYDKDINGTGASTTGNIYGIYDMVGGAYEYVMANNNNVAGDSGFSDPLTLDSKYYDLYTSNKILTACNGSECVSHAISETSGWYSDTQSVGTSTYSWMVRSGHYGEKANAGIFYIGRSSYIGSSYGDRAFRLVVTI